MAATARRPLTRYFWLKTLTYLCVVSYRTKLHHALQRLSQQPISNAYTPNFNGKLVKANIDRSVFLSTKQVGNTNTYLSSKFLHQKNTLEIFYLTIFAKINLRIYFLPFVIKYNCVGGWSGQRSSIPSRQPFPVSNHVYLLSEDNAPFTIVCGDNLWSSTRTRFFFSRKSNVDLMQVLTMHCKTLSIATIMESLGVFECILYIVVHNKSTKMNYFRYRVQL